MASVGHDFGHVPQAQDIRLVVDAISTLAMSGQFGMEQTLLMRLLHRQGAPFSNNFSTLIFSG
jgi:hypothetical protein